MKQSKLESFIESLVNTFIGLVITMIASPFIYWMCNVEISITKQTYAALLFTILSIARGYVIRRFFNNLKGIKYKITKLWNLFLRN